ncbi:Serine/threonine-protein kinase StkP [Nocardioides dokdonensis FR1436]|uniref:non-specific serine/threonine protein kinase n=1 Tax=Nocardioides dokdonensis FR1436 TaxID=1300347 RepID=A0A1A9GPA3_9ACTN|nr:serine/threonine-protein kinase [Nocardioides dokdonensis]ANH40134.1 Serine/threonine-protein kinase StkP [Nocardioides dokdonensis FR1436]
MIAGRYTLEREIGRGGMGAVWLGRDEILGRAVAIKRLGAVPGQDPDARERAERAEREARLAARLSHPHVVAVYDLVEDGDQQYLVMEHVDGTNLSGYLRAEGPLSPDRAARMLGQAADALAAAHHDGIVHRDVKPSNMLVTADGQVKLSDFGIARSDADPSLTRTGLVTGSPAYLAPEVASGSTATARSDVWSLGASLFHALAGHPPYEVGDNVLGALYRIVHEDPPRLDDPGWLGPLLEATMCRDPEQRWDMATVRDVLLSGPAHAAAGADSTQVLERVQDAPALTTAGVPTVIPTAVGTGRSQPPPADPAGPGRDRRRLLVPVLLAVSAAVVLVVIALVVGVGRDAGTDPEAGATPTARPSETTEPEPDPGPSAEDIEQFAADYVRTAVADPSQGFALLTPAYQRASGRLEGYTGFWGSVQEIRDFQMVEADPEAGTATYTYTYRRDGRSVTETVELTLQPQAGGGFLISGARTV